jgi:uncharacterized protein YprB with RNaseH-like and TPR domain
MRDLKRIAERLHRRAARLQELELSGEQELGPYLLARTPYQEISAALRLKEALLAEFARVKLEELYPCSEVENEFGRVLRLEGFIPQRLALFDRQRSYRVLSSQLRLLYGIGPRIEQKLRERGYRTLEDLKAHPRFGREAARLLQDLRRGDLPELAAAVERWLGVSHPLTLALTGLAGEKLVFFDLESLGLFGRPLVLLGLARPREDGLLIEQYVIRSITEELAAIAAAVELIEQAEALVTYNGRAFDVNYLEERLSYYGFPKEITPPNFDLLYHARRYFKNSLPDCRLETVERHVLGRERPFDVPSALVPDFYNTYLEERNIGPLVAIIEHNKQDLISLAALLGRLCSER